MNGNEFFILNKVYQHAKLKQWGTGYRDYGTGEEDFHPGQMWRLTEGTGGDHGYFYINSVEYPRLQVVSMGWCLLGNLHDQWGAQVKPVVAI